MNVRPGDLAYVVGTRVHPECNGMIVEVLSAASPGFWYVRGHALEEYAKRHGFFRAGRIDSVRDDKLRPIRGDGITDDTPAELHKLQTVEA
jgi:hypothetical protein